MWRRVVGCAMITSMVARPAGWQIDILRDGKVNHICLIQGMWPAAHESRLLEDLASKTTPEAGAREDQADTRRGSLRAMGSQLYHMYTNMCNNTRCCMEEGVGGLINVHARFHCTKLSEVPYVAIFTCVGALLVMIRPFGI
jgi:hypothetical protein